MTEQQYTDAKDIKADLKNLQYRLDRLNYYKGILDGPSGDQKVDEVVELAVKELGVGGALNTKMKTLVNNQITTTNTDITTKQTEFSNI